MPDLPDVPAVVIDRLTAADAPALAVSHSDPDNARYQGWKSPLSEAEARAFIADQEGIEPLVAGTGVQLAIRERPGGPLAGDLYVARTDSGEQVELGITLVPGFGGRGLATAAIAAAAATAFADPAVARVVGWVHVDNVRSRALFERLGFRLVEEVDDEVRYEAGPGECRIPPGG